MASIDELQIELNANASKVNDAIDRLEGKIAKLSTSLIGLDTSKLAGLANGVNKLATSMQSMKSVGTADFTRLAKNLNALGSVNTANLNRLASATTQISKSIVNLSGATQGVTALGSLANGIRKLGQPASVTAATNIPRLTVAIGDMARRLSGAKSVSTNLIQITRAIASLSRVTTNDAIANIPRLTSALNNMITTLSQAPKVSKNLIQLTYAISGLSRVSGRTGNSTRIVRDNLFSLPSATSRANKGFTSLASTIGKVYATYFLLFRAFGKIGNAMELASNLTEVENVIDHTFGALRTKLDDFTSDSIEKFGLSELAAKQYAGRFQAMGKAMGISNDAMAKSTEFLNEKLGESAKVYGDLGNTMADMSVNLTKLTSDYASFFDVAQSDVAEDFQSIFTGQTKPLRTYGLDLTEATLKEYALRNGLNANINAMSQAEKAMLRYQYVMDNSSHIMGDFARTSDTWHNTIVRLKNNFQALGTTVGKAFINLLKPVAVFVNNAIVGLNKVAVAISNALGKLLGWEYEEGSGGIATEYEDAADSADDLATGTGKAAKAAKELKKQLQGIDELNVLTTNDDNGGGGGSGGGSSVGGGGATGTDGSWAQRENPWISDIDTWQELGSSIRDGLISAMDDIDWDSIYKTAENFATGLAEFLNGLFAKDKNGKTVFGSLAETIAGSLDTALHFLDKFGETFDWTAFGDSLADGVNRFFAKFDFDLLADTLNIWVDGLEESIISFVKGVDWKEVIKGAMDFVGGLELDTLAVMIGTFAWFHGGKELVKGAIKGLLSTAIETGIGDGTVTLGTAIAVSFVTAKIGFEIGKWLYNNTEFSKFADAVIEWMTTENGTEIDIPKAIGLTLGSLALTIGGLKVTEWIIGGAIKKASELTAGIVSGEVGASLASALGFADVASMSFAVGTAAAKLGILVGVALAGYKIGNKIYESLTGEDAQGGLKDLIFGDYTWSEIGQAISDGAIVDLLLTPFIQWWSGDDTITTDEIVDAGAQMIGDVLEKWSEISFAPINFALSLLPKLQEAYDDAVEWLEDYGIKFELKIPTFAELKTGFETLVNEAVKILNAKFGLNIPTIDELKLKFQQIADGAVDILNATFGLKIPKFSDLKDGFVNLVEKIKGVLKTVFTINAPSWKSIKDKFTGENGIVAKIASKLKSVFTINAPTWKSIKERFVGENGILTTLKKKLKLTLGINAPSWAKDLKDKFKGLIDKLKEAFTITATVKSPISTVADVAKTAYNKLKKKKDGGIYSHGRWTDIPQYAVGGFPDRGTMFVAGEAGAEVVGHINGQTEVLNQSQMARVMYDAVRSANAQQNALIQQQNDYLYQLLQKETGISYKDVFEATRKGASEYQIMNGRPAFV